MTTLTPRQKAVVILIASGTPYKTIASYLGISKKCVEYHSLKAKRKTGVKGIAGLARWAVKEGLVSA